MSVVGWQDLKAYLLIGDLYTDIRHGVIVCRICNNRLTGQNSINGKLQAHRIESVHKFTDLSPGPPPPHSFFFNLPLVSYGLV